MSSPPTRRSARMRPRPHRKISAPVACATCSGWRRALARLKRLQKEAAALRGRWRWKRAARVLSQPVYRAWQFLTGKLTADDRLPKLARPKSDPDVVDPALDSLFVAVAKLGGIDRAELEAQWGAGPEGEDRPAGFRQARSAPQRRAQHRRDAQPAGAVRLSRRQRGGPDWNPREFEDRFFEELGGARGIPARPTSTRCRTCDRATRWSISMG